MFKWFEMLEQQSRALSTLLVFITWILIAVFIVYPLLRYIICRIMTWFMCKIKLNSQKNSKNSWTVVGRGFAWPFLPSWSVKKPDFVLYSKGVTYAVKLHAFYSMRKKIVFCSPERWSFTRERRRRKFEKLMTIQAIDQDYKEMKTKPAPFYMLRYAQAIAKEIDAPCVPVIMFAPRVKFLYTGKGVVMNNGDYTFYGMVIADNKSFGKTTAVADENAIPALTAEEKKAAEEKIKKVLKEDLR